MSLFNKPRSGRTMTASGPAKDKNDTKSRDYPLAALYEENYSAPFIKEAIEADKKRKEENDKEA